MDPLGENGKPEKGESAATVRSAVATLLRYLWITLLLQSVDDKAIGKNGKKIRIRLDSARILLAFRPILN